MDLHAYIGQLEKRMREAAANLEFEEAARLRDEIRKLEDKELGLATARAAPAPRPAGAAWKPSSGSRDDKRRAAQAKSKARRRVGP
jgi:excinuclease ABC subunit B